MIADIAEVVLIASLLFAVYLFGYGHGHKTASSVVADLLHALAECADDLASEIHARASGDLPRRIERDMSAVYAARALIDKVHGHEA